MRNVLVLLLFIIAFVSAADSKSKDVIMDNTEESTTSSSFRLNNKNDMNDKNKNNKNIVVYTVEADWIRAMQAEGYKVRKNNMDEALAGRDYYDLPDGTTKVGRFAIKLSAQGKHVDNSLWIDSQNRQNYEGQFSSTVNLKFYDFLGVVVCGLAGVWKQYRDGTQGDVRLLLNNDYEEDMVLHLSDLLQGDDVLNESRFIGFVVTTGFTELRFVTEGPDNDDAPTKFNVRRLQMSTSCGNPPTTRPSRSPTQRPTVSPAPTTTSRPTNPTAAPSQPPTIPIPPWWTGPIQTIGTVIVFLLCGNIIGGAIPIG